MILTAVGIAGASVMIYEFIAVRILQRYFGGQLDVWASEIAVCMAGLALGYTFGGQLADRYRSPRLFGIALMLAGGLGAFILPVAEAAGERLLEIDTAIAWQPLIAAMASSFLPFLALGTVVPQAIRLVVRDFSDVGATAGNVVALSTAGSIVGVLASGMYLLTHFGISETLYATSCVLVATGFIVAIPRYGVAAILFALLMLPGTARAQIIFEDYSAYHHILVEDTGGTRILWFDNDQETLMSLSDPYAGGFEYADFFHVPMLFDPTIRRVLFMGLGGGTGPKSFLKIYPKVRIEVVEIDPMVVTVARKYFAVPNSSRLRIVTADGRAYLRRARGTYGAIMLDAYASSPRGGYIPYHLATQEFFRIVYNKLDNGGCLVYNVIVTPEFGTVLTDLSATIRTVFQVVYAFGANSSQNAVIVAMKIDYAALDEDGSRDGQYWPNGPWLDQPQSSGNLQALAAELVRREYPLLPALEFRLDQFTRIRGRGTILVDNFAPTDAGSQRRRRRQ